MKLQNLSKYLTKRCVWIRLNVPVIFYFTKRDYFDPKNVLGTFQAIFDELFDFVTPLLKTCTYNSNITLIQQSIKITIA